MLDIIFLLALSVIQDPNEDRSCPKFRPISFAALPRIVFIFVSDSLSVPYSSLKALQC